MEPNSRVVNCRVAVLTLSVLLTLLLYPTQRLNSQETRDVSVKLKWQHQTQFAGIYLAAARGFYAREGLAVHTLPWKLGNSPIQQVVSGAATFGITSHTQFLIEREKGAPIVAIAAIYQKSPVGFFALESSGIEHPRDFMGQTIAFAPTHEIHLKAMLKQLGLDPKRLEVVPYGFDLTPWLTGQVKIWGGYIMNQPVEAQLAGHGNVSVIFPDDYRVHTYDDIIFTTEQVIAQDPALVERWLRATLEGWRYAIEHTEEATKVTLEVDPTLASEKQMRMLLASIPLIHTGENPIGWMTEEVWQKAMEIMLDQKILENPVPLAEAYTTSFLKRIYQE